VAAWSDGADALRSLERARELTKRLDSVPIDARSGHWVFVLPSRGERCPSLAQLASEPGGAELRALLDERSLEAWRRKCSLDGDDGTPHRPEATAIAGNGECRCAVGSRRVPAACSLTEMPWRTANAVLR
jgi:hypothetical protein